MLEAHLSFLAAYANALGGADARSERLRRRSRRTRSPNSPAGSAADAGGVTLREPVAMRPRGSGALTMIVDDGPDGSAQRRWGQPPTRDGIGSAGSGAAPPPPISAAGPRAGARCPARPSRSSSRLATQPRIRLITT